MPYILLILMIGAIVGLIRPYPSAPQIKRWHYGLIAFASFIGIGITAPDQSETPNVVTGTTPDGAPVEPAKKDASVGESEQQKSKWEYDSQNDEMRGSESRYATLNSENTIKFDFPYGEQPGVLTLRQDPQYGFDVMFSVPSGQILCHSFSDAYLNVKFDDGPIQKFGCSEASDGSSEVSFVSNAKGFLFALRRSKRAVIEAEFFQAGRQQYIFDTQGLVWEN